MPEYLYRCANGHERPESHGMLEEPKIICHCGEDMWRVPQPTAVVWGGLRPSQGEIAPYWSDNAVAERRDEFEKEHDEHEQRS